MCVKRDCETWMQTQYFETDKWTWLKIKFDLLKKSLPSKTLTIPTYIQNSLFRTKNLLNTSIWGGGWGWWQILKTDFSQYEIKNSRVQLVRNFPCLALSYRMNSVPKYWMVSSPMSKWAENKRLPTNKIEKLSSHENNPA